MILGGRVGKDNKEGVRGEVDIRITFCAKPLNITLKQFKAIMRLSTYKLFPFKNIALSPPKSGILVFWSVND
jgi:hypothetical protein